MLALIGDLSLEMERVDLWLVSTEVVAPDGLDACRALMSEEERRRERAFRFDGDRWRHVISRALVRTVLSRYVVKDPSAWRFSSNRYGRPEVSEEQDPHRVLSFNLSHTRNMIALAVRGSLAVGVDVETTPQPGLSIDLAERFFAPTEAAALSRVRGDDFDRSFLEYWTLKEAYIKARGAGLSIPLSDVSFDLSLPSSVRMTIASALHDSSTRWRCWLLHPTESHTIAVCAEREVERLVVRQCAPFGEGAIFQCAVLRDSAIGAATH